MKTLSNTFIATVAGLTLAAGSMAYAQNPTTPNDTHTGMTGQTTQHDMSSGMQNMPSPQVMMDQIRSHMGSGMGQTDGKKNCNLTSDNQDKKS